MRKSNQYKRCLPALALTLAIATPMSSLAATHMVVKGGALNLRKEPSLTAQVLRQFPTGTWMTVESEADGWSKVTVNGMEGYVMSKYLSDAATDGTLYVRTNTGRGLNLRDQPSLEGNIITSFKPGTAVKVITRGNGWYKVSVGDKEGYMSSRFLTGSQSAGTGTTTPTGYPKTGTVKNPGANQVLLLRETASTDARVLGYYRNGTTVKLLGESGSFYKVSVGGRNGYMMKKYIKVGGAAVSIPAVLPQAPFTAKLVNPNGNHIVNFRTEPGLSAPIIKAHAVGTKIKVLSVGDVWCKAEIDGVTGYVSRYFFVPEK